MTAVPIPLRSRVAARGTGVARVLRVSRGQCDTSLHDRSALLIEDGEPIVNGDWGAVLLKDGCADVTHPSPVLALPLALSYLADGDVIRIDPMRGWLHTLYRKTSRHNTMLVTERCNSYCVMCSQPPKDDDDQHLWDQWLEAVPLMDPATGELGISGGEPTLDFDRFLELVTCVRQHLPSTALHVLTNGRTFCYLRSAQRLAAIQHADLMLGIPLYADVPWIHDHVVQARGAFDQTIRGLLNLARCGVHVEIRVVIHRLTAGRLPELGAFIARNLPFAHQVALMGLEHTGHTPMNLDALWIDPVDYQPLLKRCISALVRGGVQPLIYNLPLCVLDPDIRPFAVQSISDWKNVYVPACDGCVHKDDCCGFFAFNTNRVSRGILPFSETCLPISGH